MKNIFTNIFTSMLKTSLCKSIIFKIIDQKKVFLLQFLQHLSSNFILFPQTLGEESIHLRLQSTMAERVSSRAPYRDIRR